MGGLYKRLRDTEALLAVACFLISLTVLDRDPLARPDIAIAAIYWFGMVMFGLRSWATHRKLRALAGGKREGPRMGEGG